MATCFSSTKNGTEIAFRKRLAQHSSKDVFAKRYTVLCFSAMSCACTCILQPCVVRTCREHRTKSAGRIVWFGVSACIRTQDVYPENCGQVEQKVQPKTHRETKFLLCGRTCVHASSTTPVAPQQMYLRELSKKTKNFTRPRNNLDKVTNFHEAKNCFKHIMMQASSQSENSARPRDLNAASQGTQPERIKILS